MTWKTHLIGGIQAGAVIAYAYGGRPTDTALIVGASMLGSLLPDIDCTSSKLAKRDVAVGAIAFTLSRFTKHRGLTHTIPGAAAFALLFYFLAMFNTGSENVIALYAAGISFLLINAAGMFRRYGLYLAVIIYLAAPRITEYLSTQTITLHLSGSSARLFAYGIFAGCISHMIYDTFNPKGIMWLWPLTRKTIHLANVKTRSTGESFFGFLQTMILAFGLSYVFKNTYMFRDNLLMEFIKDTIDDFRWVFQTR